MNLTFITKSTNYGQHLTDAVVRRGSTKLVFSKFSKYETLISMPSVCNFVIKETPVHVISSEFCKNFRAPFFQTTSGRLLGLYVRHIKLNKYAKVSFLGTFFTEIGKKAKKASGFKIGKTSELRCRQVALLSNYNFLHAN